jgi:hypothetical protein
MQQVWIHRLSCRLRTLDGKERESQHHFFGDKERTVNAVTWV